MIRARAVLAKNIKNAVEDRTAGGQYHLSCILWGGQHPAAQVEFYIFAVLAGSRNPARRGVRAASAEA